MGPFSKFKREQNERGGRRVILKSIGRKKCKNCGFVERSTAKYCGRCGVTFQTSREKFLKKVKVFMNSGTDNSVEYVEPSEVQRIINQNLLSSSIEISIKKDPEI